MKDLFGKLTKDPGRRRLLLYQLIIILAACILAASSCMRSADGGILQDGNRLPRADPGGTDKEYDLYVGGLADSYEHISVKVSSREYSSEEAHQQFEYLMEGLAEHIVGNNLNLGAVSTDLVLPRKIDGFDGITLTWYPEDRDLISADGTVSNRDLEKSADTRLNVILESGGYEEEFSVPVTVLPAGAYSPEMLLEELDRLIADADEEQISEEFLVLPGSIGGISLSYFEKKDSSWIQILAAGIVAAVLIGLKPGQDRIKERKARETELLLDYSEAVSKLMIYMGAGLTVRNAWISISERYQEALAAGRTARRAVYDEMLTTAGELAKGVPEARALNDFSRRCSQKCYLKLVSLLEQNTRTGDAGLEAAMRLEIQEAFEQRKNIARRLGEEAGTKLMLPLIISLINVFMIVGVPAMMSLA